MVKSLSEIVTVRIDVYGLFRKDQQIIYYTKMLKLTVIFMFKTYV